MTSLEISSCGFVKSIFLSLMILNALNVHLLNKDKETLLLIKSQTEPHGNMLSLYSAGALSLSPVN